MVMELVLWTWEYIYTRQRRDLDTRKTERVNCDHRWRMFGFRSLHHFSYRCFAGLLKYRAKSNQKNSQDNKQYKKRLIVSTPFYLPLSLPLISRVRKQLDTINILPPPGPPPSISLRTTSLSSPGSLFLMAKLFYVSSIPRKKPTDHVGRDRTSKVSSRKRRPRKVRRLAKLVAAREGECIHYRQDERNR